MATKHPAEAEQDTSPRAIMADRLNCIMGTGWCKTTGRREKWRKDQLIDPDTYYKNFTHSHLPQSVHYGCENSIGLFWACMAVNTAAAIALVCRPLSNHPLFPRLCIWQKGKTAFSYRGKQTSMAGKNLMGLCMRCNLGRCQQHLY